MRVFGCWQKATMTYKQMGKQELETNPISCDFEGSKYSSATHPSTEPDAYPEDNN